MHMFGNELARSNKNSSQVCGQMVSDYNKFKTFPLYDYMLNLSYGHCHLGFSITKIKT